MRGLPACALALLLGAPAGAAENPGITAAPVLLIPMGSRALGMGTAYTAVASDVSALHYNPAGLSRLNAHEAAVTFLTGLADNTLQHAAYGGPLPFTGLSGGGYASAGGSLLFAQNGTIEINRTNPDGSFQGSERRQAGSDMVLTLGYAERVGSTPLAVREQDYAINHFLGVSGKLIRSTLVETYSATAVTADAGYLVHCPDVGLTFGASALNLGGRLRYVDQSDPLPTTLRAGLARQVGEPSWHVLTLAADGEYLLHERQLFANAGLESFWLKSYGLRVGYQFLRDNLGLTVGFGVRWRARILLDYAWLMGGGLNDSHRVTFTYRFGGVAPAMRGRQRRPFIETAPERQPIEGLEEQVPRTEPAPRPRPVPREERPTGVPGWIY